MHGIVFGELRQYVHARLGESAWNELLAEIRDLSCMHKGAQTCEILVTQLR